MPRKEYALHYTAKQNSSYIRPSSDDCGCEKKKQKHDCPPRPCPSPCAPCPSPCVPCPACPNGCRGIPITAAMVGNSGILTISESGHYFIEDEDVVVNPAANPNGCIAAIVIDADNVYLDGCFHTLRQLRGVNEVRDVIGIIVRPFRSNIFIDRITIADFSALGIWVEYGVDNFRLGDDVSLLNSGYAGGSCYPVLDGFNPSQEAFAAGGIAFGGVLAGNPWFTDPLNPVAPFDQDLPVTNVILGKFKSTGHISEDSPITKTSPFTGITLSLTKTIGGVGGANVYGYVADKTYIANIHETTPVDFNTRTGGGTARGFTLANGRRGVIRGVVANDVQSTLGLTVINVSPGQDNVFENCSANNSLLLEDVLFPTRGVVGIGAGGAPPNTENAIPSFNNIIRDCNASNIGVGPNVTGTRQVGTFPGGGFATAFNVRGSTNSTIDGCHAVDIEGAGNMLTSGFHIQSDTILRDSTVNHSRTTGEAEDPEDFNVNGVGVLIAPPPRNAPPATNIDFTIEGVGKSIISNVQVRDASVGFRIIDINANGDSNNTSVLIEKSAYIPMVSGDQAQLYTGVNNVFSSNNNFIN